MKFSNDEICNFELNFVFLMVLICGLAKVFIFFVCSVVARLLTSYQKFMISGINISSFFNFSNVMVYIPGSCVHLQNSRRS